MAQPAPLDSNALLQQAQEQIVLSKRIEDQTKQAVKIVGDEHRYQAYLIIFLTCCGLLLMYQLTGPSYYFMNPIFHCNGSPVSEEEACTRLEQCTLINDYTITARIKLYCGERIKERNLIQSMIGYGSLTGLVIINFLSDYKGRRFSLLLALFVQTIAISLLIAGALAQSSGLILCSQLISGLSTISMLSVSYVILDKLLSKKLMTIAVLIMNGFSSFAEVSLLLFTNYLDWQVLAIYFVLVPSILLYFTGCYLLVEDPALLYSQNQIQKSCHSLTKIAKWNRRQDRLQEAVARLKQMESQGLSIPSQKSKSFIESLRYLKLLGDSRIMVPIICLGLNSIGGNVIYYALNFSASTTGNSYGITMCLFGLAEFTGVLPLIYLGARIPRKKALITIALVTVVIQSMFFLKLEPIIQSILIFVIRFIQCQQYAIYIYLAVETFPQHIQSTSIGIVEVIGQPAKVIAPYIVQFAESLSISPVALISIQTLCLMVIPILLLKETVKTSLPQDEPNLEQSLLSTTGEEGEEKIID